MKRIILLTLITIVFACKNEAKKDEDMGLELEQVQDDSINILEHPYIFEDDGFQIEKLTYEELDDKGNYLFSLIVSGNTEKFEKDHRVFVHGFNDNNTKNYVLNIVMEKTRKENTVKQIKIKIF